MIKIDQNLSNSGFFKTFFSRFLTKFEICWSEGLTIADNYNRKRGSDMSTVLMFIAAGAIGFVGSVLFEIKSKIVLDK